MGKLVTGAALILAVLAAMFVGPNALAAVVVTGAVVTLLDAGALMRRVGAPPVLLVALLPGVGLPVSAALDPAAAWGRMPVGFALAVLAAFPLLLLFGRRRQVVTGLGTALALALVVGVGAASILLLRDLPEGVRWLLALAVLVVAADVAGPLMALARRRGHDHAADDPAEAALAVPLDAVLPALLAVALVAGVLYLVLAPPLGVGTLALLALVAVIATLGGEHLQRSLRLEGGMPPAGGRGLRTGELFRLADGLLLAAPPAYVIVRAVVL